MNSRFFIGCAVVATLACCAQGSHDRRIAAESSVRSSIEADARDAWGGGPATVMGERGSRYERPPVFGCSYEGFCRVPSVADVEAMIQAFQAKVSKRLSIIDVVEEKLGAAKRTLTPLIDDYSQLPEAKGLRQLYQTMIRDEEVYATVSRTIHDALDSERAASLYDNSAPLAFFRKISGSASPVLEHLTAIRAIVSSSKAEAEIEKEYATYGSYDGPASRSFRAFDVMKDLIPAIVEGTPSHGAASLKGLFSLLKCEKAGAVIPNFEVVIGRKPNDSSLDPVTDRKFIENLVFKRGRPLTIVCKPLVLAARKTENLRSTYDGNTHTLTFPWFETSRVVPPSYDGNLGPEIRTSLESPAAEDVLKALRTQN